MIAVEPVGICGFCGEPVMLRLDEGRRSIACACGWADTSERFFAVCGYGNAAAVSLLARLAAQRVVQGDAFDEAAYIRAVKGPADPRIIGL